MVDATRKQIADWPAVMPAAAVTARHPALAMAVGLAEPANDRPATGPCRRWRQERTAAWPTQPPRHIGQIERMTIAVDQLSPARSRLLGLLLHAADPATCGGPAVLRPIWANETMSRAYQMVRLTRQLDCRLPVANSDAIECMLEHRLAQAIADALLSLHIDRDGDPLPCSEILRSVVRNLVELFGPVAGKIAITTAIDRLELSAFRRRALILLASHLVIRTLLHAFWQSRSGRILVTLEQPTAALGRLTIGHDDEVIRLGPLEQNDGVTDDLGDLLESELEYRKDERGKMGASIEFPTR